MGQYRFAIPDSERFVADSLIAGQIVGLEGIPWPGKTLLHESLLLINRNTNISGRLLLPWKTPGFGELSLTTGTLPEVAEPYLLDVELARGSLSRLRNQVSIWSEGGLNIPADFQNALDATVEAFSTALFSRNLASQRVQICEQVLDRCVELMFQITDRFSDQIAALHNAQTQPVPVIAGTVRCLPTPVTDDPSMPWCVQQMSQPEIRVASEKDMEPLDFGHLDRVVDWLDDVNAKSVRIGGPLLPFDHTQLPCWIPGDGTFEDRVEAARRLCRRLGALYQKRIKILHVTSGISGVGHQHFNYPQQLQMTLEMLESLDQVMPNTSMMVSFDQPWGERLSMATGGVPAMEIADSLLRYGARISAIGLEFNLDYWPQGTMMRDPLQWVDMIDRWSQFGLPLVIYLSAPTGDTAKSANSRFLQTIRGNTHPARLAKYLTTVFNLLVRRPAVNVVAWRYWADNENQRFPLAGLVDDQGQPKPMWEWFQSIVQEVTQQPASTKSQGSD